METNEELTVVPQEQENFGPKISKPAIKYGWLRAVLFLIVALIVTGLMQYVGIILATLASGNPLSSLSGKTITQIMESLNLPSEIFIQILGFGGMLLIAWIFRKFIDKKPFISLGLDIKNYVGDFLKGFGWGVGIISFGFVALYFTGNIAITSIQFNFGSFIGYFVFFIIVALNEEIMVRGYMLNNLFDSMNKYVALLITAVLFGAMHMGNPNASSISLINIILAGLILGIYYVHKKNLWFPIGMHLSWNFFQGPVWGFEVSGTSSTGIFTLERLGHDLVTGGEFGFEASILATIIIAASTLAIHFQYKKQSVK